LVPIIYKCRSKNIVSRYPTSCARTVLRYVNVKYTITNAEALTFEDNTFDLVTIAFGLRNVTRKDKALEEIYRVLKPGGQLMVLEDSENGCRAAVRAGTHAVAVPGNHSDQHDFGGSRLIADSLGDPGIYAALGL